MNRNRTRDIALSAMFLAIGQVLPFITGQIPQVGRMLLPMHFPVFLCAFVCGGKWAALIGFICPLLRSVLFGMPVMYPSAIGMAFELCTYGLVTGMVFSLFGRPGTGHIYLSLLCGMLAGRVVWGIATFLLMGFQHNAFTWEAFMAGAFLNAVPGIILQLILIPVLVRTLQSVRLIRS